MNVSFDTNKSMFMCRQCVQKWENVFFFQLMEDCWPWTIVSPAQKNDIFPERTWSDTGSTLSPNTLFSWFLVSLNIVPDSMERLSIVQPLYMAFVWKFKKWTWKHGSRDSFTLFCCSTVGELMDWLFFYWAFDGLILRLWADAFLYLFFAFYLWFFLI